MLWRCIGCSKSFDTSKGLANHRRKCQAHKAVAAQVLRARLGDFRRHKEAGQAALAQVPVQQLFEEQLIEMEADIDLERPEVSLD
jgi:hypothetical protein